MPKNRKSYELVLLCGHIIRTEASSEPTEAHCYKCGSQRVVHAEEKGE